MSTESAETNFVVGDVVTMKSARAGLCPAMTVSRVESAATGHGTVVFVTARWMNKDLELLSASFRPEELVAIPEEDDE